jgi:inosose dehydratase
MTTDSITLATGPVSWGVDFADSPGNPPWERVLDEIAESPVSALELGPVGYLPEDPDTLRAALRMRGLTAVGSCVFENLHDPASRKDVMSVAERACQAIAAAGGSVVVLIDRPSQERAATAGRHDDAPRLPAAQLASMLKTIESVASLAEDHGLRPTIHPHAGGYIEFLDEIERLLEETQLALCLDTGHLAYAGIVPADAITRFGSRLEHLHLKDIDGAVLERVRAHRLGFWDAVAANIFCPVGEGIADFPAVWAALRQCRYRGYATLEQDREANSGAPAEDLRRSVRVLARIATRREAE